jgi:hypothetical protein
MLTIYKEIDSNNYNSHDITYFLYKIYNADLCKMNVHLEKYWKDDFLNHVPRTKNEKLYYFTRETDTYNCGNHKGIMTQKYIWPEFFKSFPNGKIIVLECSQAWEDIMLGLAKIDISSDLAKQNINQCASGLTADQFIILSLNAIANGFYPYTLFCSTPGSSRLTYLYIPEKPIKHSQMKSKDAFNHILWDLHNVFDDQWTFDGSRGPKSKIHINYLRIPDTLDYIKWSINLISDKIKELISEADNAYIIKFVNTYNRACCDCILATSIEHPYMAKTFFFACIDKISNILYGMGKYKKDQEALMHLYSDEFLKRELTNFIKKIPGNYGEIFADRIKWANFELKYDMPVYHEDDGPKDILNLDLMRIYRNTIHGYFLRDKDVKLLYKHSGEINNDITCLALPILLYALSLKIQK